MWVCGCTQYREVHEMRFGTSRWANSLWVNSLWVNSLEFEDTNLCFCRAGSVKLGEKAAEIWLTERVNE